MKFIKLEKVKDGKYLKNYEITYLNKAGKEKKYEIVSRKELREAADIGRAASGISIVAFHDGKLLLLREFRMSVNKTIFNLCAGMIEEGETVEECISRELYEETGHCSEGHGRKQQHPLRRRLRTLKKFCLLPMRRWVFRIRKPILPLWTLRGSSQTILQTMK